MSATRELMDPIDFHTSRENTMKVNGVQLSGYRQSSKYRPLGFSRI